MLVQIFAFLLFGQCLSKVYFSENFDSDFAERWTYTKDTSQTQGVFILSQKRGGSFDDTAIKTANDSSFYQMSAPFREPFQTRGKHIFVNMVVAYEQDADCGGAYIKLLPKMNPHEFNANTPYMIMFGPDVCGYSVRKVHLIFHHKGTNHQIKTEIPFTLDKKPRFLQLAITPDRKFSVKLDGKVVSEGPINEHFPYLPPKTIDDPSDSKPEDWVDEENIVDESDKKPEDWDDRKTIVDPKASKPEDWDEATDGEWEAPSIDNPDYKGEWTAKMIPNPLYKGEWKARQIPNPEFVDDDSICDSTLEHIAFEIWQVRSGTLFDDFLVTDDESEAKKHEQEVEARIKEQLKIIEAEDEIQRKKMAEESKKLQEEEEAKKSVEEGDSDEDSSEKESHEDL